MAVTLRVRLLIALLALALVPTAVFTVFTLDQLQRATERWFSPSVERSLESALEVSRASLARMEALAIAQADEWALGHSPRGLDGERAHAAPEIEKPQALRSWEQREDVRQTLACEAVPAAVASGQVREIGLVVAVHDIVGRACAHALPFPARPENARWTGPASAATSSSVSTATDTPAEAVSSSFS